MILNWAGGWDKRSLRAAIVGAAALDVKPWGGSGDVPRTLNVCGPLVDDHEDMPGQALSWALRELVAPDAGRERLHCGAQCQAKVAREARSWQQVEHRPQITEKDS